MSTTATATDVPYFQGTTSSYVIINPFHGFPSKEITAEFWIKPGRTQKTSGLVSYATPSEDDSFLILNHHNLQLFVQGASLQPSVAFPNQKWGHIAVSWRSAGGAVSVYKGGEQVYSGSVAAGASIPDSGSLVFAVDQDSVGGGFKADRSFCGQMSDIRIWKRVRSDAEIQADMHRRLTGHESGLVGYWPLDEGDGKIAYDKSPHGNHGMIKGGKWQQAELDLAAPQTETAWSTGLADYGYWSRWQQTLEHQERGEELDQTLEILNSQHDKITAGISDRYAIKYDGTNEISDGGGDMYDAGNRLFTDRGRLPYSDNQLVNNAYLGPKGRYFTRQFQHMFVFAADLDGIKHFEIQGGLGADHGGSASGEMLEMKIGSARFRGFVKRVFGAGDPSVNHLIVVPDQEQL